MSFKRVIAGIAGLSLLTASLTGCSQAELDMLNMTKTVSSWTTFTSDGTLDLSINKDGIVSVASLMGADVSVEDLSEVPSKATVDFDLSANLTDFSFGFDFDVKIDDKIYPLDIQVAKDKVALSKATVDSVASFIQDYNIADLDTGKIAYMQEVTKDGYAIFEGEVGDFNQGTNLDDLNLVFEGLKSAYSGYSSSMISGKAKNEVVLNVNIDTLEKEILNVLNYTADNRDAIVKVVDDIISKIMSGQDTEVSTNVASVDASVPSVEEIKGAAAKVTEFINTDEYKSIKDVFKDSYFKETMKLKSNTEYDETSELVIKASGVELFALKASANCIQKDVAPIDIKGTIITEDGYRAWYYDKYPTSKVTISWYADDYSNATLTSYSDLSESLTDYVPMTIIDDRVYVPMRAISEALGFDVVWDADNHRAYAVNSYAEFVDMTGVIVNDLTYVKVRDFEKLHLTVDYAENGSLRTATISK